MRITVPKEWLWECASAWQSVRLSATYGILSYQTAYLKANFPVEFMSVSITSHMDDVKKASIYIKEAIRMGIPVPAIQIDQ